MQEFDLTQHAQTRLNLLTGEWILVSPHRTKRPWQGKQENTAAQLRHPYEPDCYLCPGNKRADGAANPSYTKCYAFTNDYSSLLSDTPQGTIEIDGLLQVKSESGICRVIAFSPDHSLTLPRLSLDAIRNIIDLWQEEFIRLSKTKKIKHIQIFENKGDIMGCSNPHPHGQIWAQSSVPAEAVKETKQQKKYYRKTGGSLLQDYLKTELRQKERLVIEDEYFVAIVPFWAVWPYETMIISRRRIQHIHQFGKEEKRGLASMLKRLTIKYDNLFQIAFPYSAGMHGAPVNDGYHPEWHWHMHFYPPLLRSASIKKFMVGYELLASPQRDITAESAAAILRDLPERHYLE